MIKIVRVQDTGRLKPRVRWTGWCHSDSDSDSASVGYLAHSSLPSNWYSNVYSKFIFHDSHDKWRPAHRLGCYHATSSTHVTIWPKIFRPVSYSLTSIQFHVDTVTHWHDKWQPQAAYRLGCYHATLVWPFFHPVSSRSLAQFTWILHHSKSESLTTNGNLLIELGCYHHATHVWYFSILSLLVRLLSFFTWILQHCQSVTCDILSIDSQFAYWDAYFAGLSLNLVIVL